MIDLSPPETHLMAEAGGAPEADSAAFVTAVALTVAGEEARLVQRVPRAFVLRMEAALEGRPSEPTPAATGDADAGTGGLSTRWLLNTRLRVDVELGRTRLSADEIVELGDGTIVALDRRADDPIDLRVNGVPFATGRLLLDNGQWAVRIDELLQTNTTNR
jgi:flagellar motor switch protein FliN/FliY